MIQSCRLSNHEALVGDWVGGLLFYFYAALNRLYQILCCRGIQSKGISRRYTSALIASIQFKSFKPFKPFKQTCTSINYNKSNFTRLQNVQNLYCLWCHWQPRRINCQGCFGPSSIVKNLQDQSCDSWCQQAFLSCFERTGRRSRCCKYIARILLNLFSIAARPIWMTKSRYSKSSRDQVSSSVLPTTGRSWTRSLKRTKERHLQMLARRPVLRDSTFHLCLMSQSVWLHFLYSLCIHWQYLDTNGKLSQVEHFDSKARVEEYAREIGVPSTFFMPSVFMTGMLSNFRKVHESYNWKESNI